MFENISVIEQEAVEKFVVDNNVPIPDILRVFRRELQAAGLNESVRLSLYNFSDCEHCPSIKLYLENIVPEEFDVEDLVVVEETIVAAIYSEIKSFDLVVVSLSFS